MKFFKVFKICKQV